MDSIYEKYRITSTGKLQVDEDGPQFEEVYYIPEFVSQEEEDYLLRQIENAPKPKWKTLANRGEIVGSNKLIAQSLPPFLNKFPDLIGRIRSTGAFSSSRNKEPNHVIVNEYLPGQGILPHEDGPAYHPVVATISLGSHAVLHYHRYRDVDSNTKDHLVPEAEVETVTGGVNALQPAAKPRTTTAPSGRSIDLDPVLSILLEPRSLIITSKSLYSEHLHGIDPLVEDRFSGASGGKRLQQTNEQEDSGDDKNSGEENQNRWESQSRIRIANANLLGNVEYQTAVFNGGTLPRSTRISLTCRDVEKVINTRSL